MNNSLESLLSPTELEELKALGLLNKIESGDLMPTYIEWLGNRLPELTLSWPHVKYICDHVQRVVDGDIKKLAISIQPRIGKTTTITVPLPVYFLDRDPRHKVILAAYSQTFANKISVKCRSLADKSGVKVDNKRRARDDWETTLGGGMRAVGVGAGAAGYGANLILIDDPVKSRKEANSPAFQEHLFDWYKDDIYTRRDTDDCPIIIIQTRWSENDLIGKVLESEGRWSENNPDGWHLINLPALAEENDPLGREIGDALCPDRFNKEQLLAIKKVMGENNFASLYQGRPTAKGGGFFKRDWFKFVNWIPKEEKQLSYVRYWDKAATITGDYTVGALLAYSRDSRNVYIVDIVRGRWSTWDREKIILETARKDFIEYGNVRIFWEEEPGSSGKDSSAASLKMLSGFAARPIPSRQSKTTRAEPLAAQLEGGNVYMVKAEWNRVLLSEFETFNNGAHDDIVDSVSGAFNQLANSNAFIKIH